MPSTITHTYIALDTLDKLNKEPKELILKNIEDYKTFASSMDILYFYNIFLFKKNIIQEVGHEWHHINTFNTFNDIIKFNKEDKDSIIFTLLSGLITHYVADSTLHPYINYLAYPLHGIKLTDKHFEIETVLDQYMIIKKEKTNYIENKTYKLQFNNKKNDKIINILNYLFNKYYSVNNVGTKYYKALKSMKFVFKYLRYDKYGIKKKIYHILDKNKFNIRRCEYLSYNFKIQNKEFYLNNNKKEWFYPKDNTIKSNKSFEELYSEIINKSSNIINKIYNYIYLNKEINLKELIPDLSYSTGLLIKKEDYLVKNKYNFKKNINIK